MTVSWKDFPIKITEITKGNQLNENSVLPQTKENLVFSPKDETKRARDKKSCGQL